MRSTLPFLAMLFASTSLAQSAPSDSLFNTDQVITIDLTFATSGFWSILTAYYANDQGQTLTADVTITDNTGTRTYPQVAVDLKGNSSYGHPGNKKSFKIDFNDNIQGQKYHGMTKIHLNNCFKDPTFMREKIFFDFCREQGVLAPRVAYANVMMNGTFWGFYNLVEPVDKNFLDRWVDDNNGNLFKAGDNFGTGSTGAADLAYYGAVQSSYTPRYELKTNETEDDWSDLIALVQELNSSSDQDLAAQFPAKWEWETMLRSLAIDNAFSNLDGYINSARNYYIYHDSTTFKWNWIKWDANESFGSYSGMGVGNLLTLAPNYVAASRPLMTKIMGVPSFYTNYLTEYCTILEGFTNEHMDPHINAIRDLIQPHVAADNNKQYTLAQFTSNIESNITIGGGGGGGTVYGLKSFIGSRSTYLSSAVECAVGVEEVGASAVPVVYPNPTDGIVQISLGTGVVISAVNVTDATGRSIPVKRMGNALDLSNFPTGMYFVRVSSAQGVRTVRIEKF